MVFADIRFGFPCFLFTIKVLDYNFRCLIVVIDYFDFSGIDLINALRLHKNDAVQPANIK